MAAMTGFGKRSIFLHKGLPLGLIFAAFAASIISKPAEKHFSPHRKDDHPSFFIVLQLWDDSFKLLHSSKVPGIDRRRMVERNFHISFGQLIVI